MNCGAVSDESKAVPPTVGILVLSMSVAHSFVILVPVTPRTPATTEAAGSPVQFVSVPLVGVPSTGVVNVGEVTLANTPVPLPVYSAEVKW